MERLGSATNPSLSHSASPLELVMQHGKSGIYERATALSRKTSVRQAPIQPTDHDDQSIHLERESTQLISNAFRDSMASDISFNSITGISLQEDRYTHTLLNRRGSMDSVKTSEFGVDGKWGRAWANRAEDEESVYGDEDWGEERFSIMSKHVDIDPSQGAYTKSGGSRLDDIARQWKASQRSRCEEEPQIHSVPAREHIVNLTRSEANNLGVPASQQRQSHVPTIQTRIETTYRHWSTDSSSTIGSGGAHVYVYPPSPSASESSVYQNQIPQSSQALVENYKPVGPSHVLSQPHGSPIIARRPNKAGHPAGRPPPPAPTQGGYNDPNRPSTPRPVLGQMRTQAIAAANGRESIVSDLDVETLRLDDSSRRDSSSTMASSRMSVGTVRYEDIGLSPPMENSALRRPPPLGSTKSSNSVSSTTTTTSTGPSTAEDFLSQGITYHEQGDLSRSAFYFERSAKVDGGCVVGMCMFGMALREGWGARKDPRKGFEWIQKAAAKAGELMQTQKSPSELKAIKSELKLSVYELGKCFCYGWGVKMDKHMALEYFELAAKLGDADAQAEAGALYASGKGCKKDLKKAAMYYRMAEEGGYDTVGLSWIHKDKYK